MDFIKQDNKKKSYIRMFFEEKTPILLNPIHNNQRWSTSQFNRRNFLSTMTNAPYKSHKFESEPVYFIWKDISKNMKMTKRRRH